ncbi:ribonuclease III [filamentous cyanobacterium CCP2]|nr:ribonuclease III [filamentous cyanobacterium CCP2]
MPNLPPFQNPLLFLQALTHRSYLNEHPAVGEDNERLEFLGDATLGFVVGAMLYRRYPSLPEGKLTQRRSQLVDQPQLATIANALDLGSQMRIGRGAEKDGGRQNPSLLSSTFEAVIGAYFLDSGFEAVQAYVEELFCSAVEGGGRSSIDPKSRFQQWALANLGHQNPTYRVIDESGAAHAKQFTMVVMVGETVYGVGTDRSKPEAGKRAAADALRRLGLE